MPAETSQNLYIFLLTIWETLFHRIVRDLTPNKWLTMDDCMSHYFKRRELQICGSIFSCFLKAGPDVFLWTPKPFPLSGVTVSTVTLSIVSVKLHNASSRLCAGFLKYILPRGQNIGPCQWENEIRLHAVRHYTLQEVNTLIQITRHLSSCGGVKTQITVLHEHRHKAPLCKRYRGI